MCETMTHNRLQLLDQVDIAIFVIDRETGGIRYSNRRACANLGKPASEILGKHYEQVFWPHFAALYEQVLAECIDDRAHTAIDHRPETARWEQVSVTAVIWDARSAALLSITTVDDLTHSDGYTFECLTHFDSLLELPNGEKLEADVGELANLESVNLIYFEILRFDEINDLYGWHNGDHLLLQVRDWLLSSEMHPAQVYRVNNGFAILGRYTTKEEAGERATEIADRFDKPWMLPAAGNYLPLYCTVKIGIVLGECMRNEIRNLLVRTIRSSKPTVHGYSVYDEAADAYIRRAMREKGMLVNCIYDDMRGFEVHYQPIVDVRSKRWIGLEALCRWRTPDGVEVPPSDFIRVAEQLNLIERVDSWVCRTAMRQCIDLNLHKKHFMLSLNFSPTQQTNAAFIGEILNVLEETGFPAEKLNLEITENVKMGFGDENLRGLRQLTEKGASLCLDDFGTGFSNFENLINLPVTVLKTDKLFLSNIEHDTYHQYLLNMLSDLARRLKMKTISEGVEKSGQFRQLGFSGINYAQGYYFSRPLSFVALKEKKGNFESPALPCLPQFREGPPTETASPCHTERSTTSCGISGR